MRSSRPCPANTANSRPSSRSATDPAEPPGELSGRQDARPAAQRAPPRLRADHSWPTPSDISSTRPPARSVLACRPGPAAALLILELNARRGALVGSPGPAGRGSPAGDERGPPAASDTDLLRRLFVLPLLLTGEHATLRRALSILGQAAAETRSWPRLRLRCAPPRSTGPAPSSFRRCVSVTGERWGGDRTRGSGQPYGARGVDRAGRLRPRRRPAAPTGRSPVRPPAVGGRPRSGPFARIRLPGDAM